MDHNNIDGSTEELRQAVREYIAAAAKLYADAALEAERAKAFLSDAESALVHLNLVIKKLGASDGQE